MDIDRYSEEFRIGNERYKLVIRDSGEVLFYLACAFRDSWGYEVDPTSLENPSNGKSVAIFRRVIELLNEMVFRYKPPVLWLRIESERRRRLYGKLVDKFLCQHPEYRSCDEGWVDRLYLVRYLPSATES